MNGLSFSHTIPTPTWSKGIFILKFVPVGTIELPRRNYGKHHVFRSQEVFHCTLMNGFFRIFESRLLSFSHIEFLKPGGRARFLNGSFLRSFPFRRF